MAFPVTYKSHPGRLGTLGILYRISKYRRVASRLTKFDYPGCIELIRGEEEEKFRPDYQEQNDIDRA